MRLRILCRLVTVLALLGGCAHAQKRELIYLGPGQKVELQDIDMKRQSLIIELHAGDTLPLDIVLEGDLVVAPTGASVPLTVQRDCFIRVDDRGLRISRDGHSFDEKARVPGSFMFGFSATEAGKRAVLRVKTPTW